MPTLAGQEDFAITIGEKIVKLIQALPEIEPGKVHCSRAYEVQVDELPCISVEIGADTPTDPDGTQSSNFEDSEQMIFVDLYDHRNDAEAIKRIALARALCHQAIMADFTLGLAFVVQARYGGASEPASDAESGLPGWTMRVAFPVHYRFNDDDRTVFNTG